MEDSVGLKIVLCWFIAAPFIQVYTWASFSDQLQDMKQTIVRLENQAQVQDDSSCTIERESRWFVNNTEVLTCE